MSSFRINNLGLYSEHNRTMNHYKLQFLKLGHCLLFECVIHTVLAKYWESIPRQVDKKSGLLRMRKGSGALKVEIGVWGSQGGEKDKLFFSTFLSLSHSHIKLFFFFSLSPELMITQQTTQFKLCTSDYITTVYTAYGQFHLPETELNSWKWNEFAQSCLTLCNPVDCSLPGSSIHGIFQARVLEWVAIFFSRGSSLPRDQTQVSHIVGRRFTLWVTIHTELLKTFWLILISECILWEWVW